MVTLATPLPAMLAVAVSARRLRLPPLRLTVAPDSASAAIACSRPPGLTVKVTPLRTEAALAVSVCPEPTVRLVRPEGRAAALSTRFELAPSVTADPRAPET